MPTPSPSPSVPPLPAPWPESARPVQGPRKAKARPRPGAAPAEARDRLLEAAVKCFAARGYQGAGIRWIAAEAGSNSALVAYHFGDKAGLYRETLRMVISQRANRLMNLLPSLPTDPKLPREEIIRGLRHYLEVYEEGLMATNPSDPLDAAALTLISREIEAPTPECEPMLMSFVQPFATYLDHCVRALRPDLDEGARFAAILGIQAPLVYLRYNRGLFELLRGAPLSGPDLDRLVQNIIDFILGELHGRAAKVRPAP